MKKELDALEVIVKKKTLCTDSRKVAQIIGKKHSNLLRDINRYVKVISENSNLNSQDFFIPSWYKSKGNNKTYTMYYLTRKGCDMVANKLTGEKGIIFTAMYVERFHSMEQLLVEQQTPSWESIRSAGKETRRRFTDCIQKLEQYAIEQGSEHPHMFYVNYSRWLNVVLGIKKREYASVIQLLQLKQLEEMACILLETCMNQGIYYRDIFKEFKKYVENCLDFISGNRLLPFPLIKGV